MQKAKKYCWQFNNNNNMVTFIIQLRVHFATKHKMLERSNSSSSSNNNSNSNHGCYLFLCKSKDVKENCSSGRRRCCRIGRPLKALFECTLQQKTDNKQWNDCYVRTVFSLFFWRGRIKVSETYQQKHHQPGFYTFVESKPIQVSFVKYVLQYWTTNTEFANNRHI